jgi:hypothetical protein
VNYEARDTGRARLEARDAVERAKRVVWELGLCGKRPMTEQEEERERAQAARTARRRAAAKERRRKAAAGPPSLYDGVESSRVQAVRIE